MLNYKELNFKCGLEIHRQIESHKLFCKCPSILQDREPDILFKRYLRAVQSESGERDLTAEYEMGKKLYALYQAYSDSNCLVEYDESPPEYINIDALKAALEVALLLNCKIFDEIIIMRKQVLDYSNTSGFQRTMLVARDGYVNIDNEKIKIQTICLEEDAARKIKAFEDHVIYKLDRLGIPLIEIVTAPDIKNPEQAKKVAQYLGMILKSTGKFKSGIGTVRQDLNVSIKNQPKIEIKGVQDLNSIPKVIEYEVTRLLSILDKNEKIISEVRDANIDNTTTYLRPSPGAARMYPETDHPTIIITKELLKGIKLPELIVEKALRFEKNYDLTPEIARIIAKEKPDLFENFVKKYKNIQPIIIAQTLVLTTKDLKSRLNLFSERLTEKNFEEVFSFLNKNIVSKDSIPLILEDILRTKTFNIEKYKLVDDSEIKNYIKESIQKNKDASLNALMGLIMNKYSGKIDGKKVMDLLKKELK